MLKSWRPNRLALRLVAALLAALMATGSLDAYHLAKDDDPDFGPAVAFAGHLAAQVGAPAPHKTASDPHCAICHWLQSLGTSRIVRRHYAAPPASRLRRPVFSRVHARVLARAQLLARGPPLA
ncbi:MAG TPA: hypothetical protein VND92_03010 [Vicinamibacterales bacterium]|nr:hypothetical protein [Vicinamibacterales bacterium]